MCTSFTITATNEITLATTLNPIDIASGYAVDINGDALTGLGGIVVDGPGRLVLSAAGIDPNGENGLAYSYSGNTTLKGGTLELVLKGPRGDGGHVVFDGPATLVFDAPPGYGQGAFSTIDGFAPGDVIDFRSLEGTTSYGSGSYLGSRHRTGRIARFVAQIRNS